MTSTTIALPSDIEARDARRQERERMAYRLNVIITSLRDQARTLDVTFEDIVTTLIMALEDDGAISDEEAQAILITVLRAANGHKENTLNVLNLLDESGTEAAIREVERLEAKYRKVKRP